MTNFHPDQLVRLAEKIRVAWSLPMLEAPGKLGRPAVAIARTAGRRIDLGGSVVLTTAFLFKTMETSR